MKVKASRTVRAAAAALSAACTLFAGAAHATTDIQMWTLLSGGDGARMKQLVDGFNDSQKDVKVTTTTLKWGEPFYTKVKTAAAPSIQTRRWTWSMSSPEAGSATRSGSRAAGAGSGSCDVLIA